MYVKYLPVLSLPPAVFQYLVQPSVWWFTLYCTRIWPMWSEVCLSAIWTRSHCSKAASLKSPWNSDMRWNQKMEIMCWINLGNAWPVLFSVRVVRIMHGRDSHFVYLIKIYILAIWWKDSRKNICLDFELNGQSQRLIRSLFPSKDAV